MNELETELSHIANFQFVHEHLFTSGQPTAEQLQHIKEYGVDTVINLAFNDAEPHLAHEDKICVELGLNYIQIPISWDTPADDQCLFVLDMIAHLVQEKIVWVHCAKNMRVSSLMYLYRQYFMDIDMPTAQELMHEIWEPNETWTGLIHAVSLQLQGRKSTIDLQHSLMNADHFA
ncbi:protein tyrosine phosphatase family protein [Acinetobacter sp. Marseille-Q1618]|uniref:protein tyrosine phosphatase family protein n=1 Tax=Acinetobacter sp. Marseille-Q1618 TaxID=2697502 RepID=UPI00156EE3B7|nr:protein tyrosine phosphatase family protein [Acinetobacter sp. Marseille-Q1618]